MSYRTWHEYGYGINPDDIDLKKLTTDRLFAFIHQAPKFEADYLNWLQDTYGEDGVAASENVTLEEMLDFENDSCYQGLGAIMQAVMQELEQISVYLCEAFDCRQYLMYTPNYPWWMKEADYAMTEDRLHEIFTKYVAMLQDDPIVIDYIECENGG